MAAVPTKIGLISDTHGLLRRQALEALHGSHLIIHAGDVGKPGILEELKKIAPVVAVRGNIDTAPWARSLPLTAVAEAGPILLYVLHNLDDLGLAPASAGFSIVICGHTHKPTKTVHNGVVYINPGSAGPRRFQLPISLARLDLAATPCKVDFVDLGTGL